MPETVQCPDCQRRLKVPDNLLGKRVKCPTCGTTFTAAGGAPPAARGGGVRGRTRAAAAHARR